MYPFNVIPKTPAELDRIVTPDGARLQAISAPLFDTQVYAAAGQAEQQFFTNASNDPTLTNLPTSGNLPDPERFEIFAATIDYFPTGEDNDDEAGAVSFEVLATPDANQPGILDDIGRLLNLGRAMTTLVIADKRYYRAPVRDFSAAGGAWGGIAMATDAASVIEGGQQFGSNGVPGNGYWIGGSIVIPPKVGFSTTIRYANAGPAVTRDYQTLYQFHGVWHRKVS